MKQIDHIGVAVNNMEDAVQMFNGILAATPFHTEEISSQKLIATFYQLGSTKVELLQATSPESNIAKYLSKKGPGIHHVAFAVDDIKAEMKRMREEWPSTFDRKAVSRSFE
ncbi:MAG: VOC family protein [Chitinophagales bacterium]|nr:VOC family protein [Chitinophagales bacterium]